MGLEHSRNCVTAQSTAEPTAIQGYKRTIAAETGLTREGLYKTLSEDGNPNLSTILKVMKAMRLKLNPEAA